MRDPATLTFRSFDGAVITMQRLALDGRPRLVLSHGNGFAIDGYRAFWSLLVRDFELVLFDLRNHGKSGATVIEAHTIGAMAKDHARVAAECRNAFGPRETYGVFHSVSAIAAALAGSSSLWDAVVLVDPPLVSLRSGDEYVRSADDRLATFARARATRFGTVQALANAFSQGVGRNWTEGSALDMARAVTRPLAGGGVELVCPGEYEARIYEQNRAVDSFGAVGAMRGPVAILGADPDAPRALHPALMSRIAAHRYGLAYEPVPGTSHMLQIERPEAAAAALRRLLAGMRNS
ncbi:MAG: alpha/beta fold hydrolase [Beijerinckiaceae bacterium]